MSQLNKQQNIPEGWTLTNVAALAEVQTGPFGSQLHESDYVKEGTPIITVENLKGGVVKETATTPQVKDEDVQRLKKYTLKEGDVVFSRVGSVDRSAYVTKDKAGWMFSGRLLRVRAKKGVRPKFLNYELSLESTKNKVRNLAVGGTMPSLNTAIFSFVPVHSLPEDEQDRIVKVLETWDRAIEKLGQTIELKREIKKGLMQKLLTGELRLPGFKGNWQKTELGTILDYQQPTNYIVSSTDYNETGTPVLTAGKSFILGYTNEKQGVYTKGEVILFDDFTTDCKFVDFDFKVKSSAMKLLTPKEGKCNLYFIFSQMQLIKTPIAEHKRRYLSEFQYIPFNTPSIDEQNAVAELLQTAQTEIDKLTDKKNKLEQQKKYLLNNLVTGQIRTPENL